MKILHGEDVKVPTMRRPGVLRTGVTTAPFG